MLLDNIISLNTSISEKEYERIASILSYYSIIPDKVEKVRGVYQITCLEKKYCLKKLGHGNSKALKGALLVDYLKSRGFNNVAEFIPSDDGRQCIKTKKYTYYLTEWIDGRECNINDLEELKRAVSFLGEFHIKSKGFHAKEVKIESNIKNWPRKLREEKHDLIRIKRMVQNKKVRTVFDTGYNDAIEKFIKFMDISIELMDKSNYMDISNRAKLERCLCHDSFYYQNILVNDTGRMFIVDLDSIIYDIHTYDLGKFIRRILYKSTYAWEFDVAKELIESYCQSNPISHDEYKVLLAFIIFPHKFWKLGKKRYFKGKKWDEEKYLKKLGRVTRYLEKQEEFIKRFMDYYNISKN